MTINVRNTLAYIQISMFYILLQACASISQPQGGKKDTKPPIYISSIPKKNGTNFKEKQIKLTFSEALDISKLKDKLIINPYSETEFDLETRGNTLIINRKKLFDPKTTYILDFQDGIKDNHEGIFIPNFKLKFSTDSTLDTTSIKGNVIDAFTKERLKNYSVLLYLNSDTLDITKHKPVYKTTTNNSGIFSFDGIRNNEYQIFAFNDLNKNSLLDIKNENIGYLTTNIIASQQKDSITIQTCKNDLSKPTLLSIKEDTENEINFNEGIYIYTITSPIKLYHELSKEKNSLIIYKTNLCEDSIAVKLYLTDSSNNDTSFTIKITNSPPKKFKTYTNIIKEITPDDKYNILGDSITTTITTEYPIHSARDSSIIYTNDSTSFKNLNLLKDFKPNTSNTSFTYTYKKKSKKFIQLIIRENTIFTNIKNSNEGYKIKYNQTIQDKLQEEELSYATININSKLPNNIIELIDEKNQVVQTDYKKKKISYKNLKPGKYNIKIIDDANNNQKWDTGNYKIRKQPEEVKIFKEILIIRKNWDIEDVDISF